MKTMKKVLCFVMVAVMMVAMMPSVSEAAGSVKLNKKKVTLTITNKKKNPKVTLKIKGVSKKAAKKAKWTTSNKKVATVKKGKVTAKKAGKATITCKVRGKKYKCRVTVKDKRKSAENGSLNITIKDMGPVSMTNVETVNRLQNETGEYDTVEHDFMPPEKVKYLNTVLRPLLSASPNYVINSQIIVTYNGKDVTDQAKYQVRLYDGTVWDTDIKDHLMDLEWIYDDSELIVTYKGKKKTIPLSVTFTDRSVSMCYCCELFDDGDGGKGLHEHQESATDYILEHGGDFYEHGGSWTFFYTVIDMKIK